MKRVGCVVMASGISERFGANKLLAPLQGKALILHTLEKLRTVPLARVVVVSPHQPVQRMAEEMGFSTLAPEGPHQNNTVCTGIRALSDIDGCMFCVGDQPLCTAGSIRRLLQAYEEAPNGIYRLYYGEQPGNPILFPASLFLELEKLPQGKGGSWLLRQYPDLLRKVQAEDASELMDVDTPEELQTMAAQLQNGRKKH